MDGCLLFRRPTFPSGVNLTSVHRHWVGLVETLNPHFRQRHNCCWDQFFRRSPDVRTVNIELNEETPMAFPEALFLDKLLSDFSITKHNLFWFSHVYLLL